MRGDAMPEWIGADVSHDSLAGDVRRQEEGWTLLAALFGPRCSLAAVFSVPEGL